MRSEQENELVSWLSNNNIAFDSDQYVEGYGKRWNVDFILPKYNIYIFCKRVAHLSTSNFTSNYLITDFLRILDIQKIHRDYIFCLLIQGLIIPLAFVIMANRYKIYVFKTFEALKDVLSGLSVEEINLKYISTLKTNSAKAYLRKKEVYKLISENNGLTLHKLAKKMNKSLVITRSDVEGLLKEGIIVSFKHGIGNTQRFYSKDKIKYLSLS